MLKYLVLALAMAAVAVQADSPAATLTKEGLTLAVKLAEFANADKALSASEASVTILAPTNAAIEAFLKEMGITTDYIQQHEALADAILAYHMVVGVTAGPKEFFAESKSVIVPTAAFPYNLTVTETATGVTVTDFQGNVANVAKADIGTGKHKIHVVDRVLYSGAYWPSLKKLTSTLPGYFSTVATAAEKAGATLTPQDATIFIPINSAFTKAGITLDADKATLENALKYHVVSGDRTIPKGFVSGEKLKTWQGQDIIVTYEVSDKTSIGGMRDATAFVTDANGNKAKVVHPNLFVSDSIGHVIDGVLMPKAEASTTAAPAAAPATTTTTTTTTTAAATTKPAATTATTTSSKTITITKPAVSVPAPATFTFMHPFVQGKGVKFTVNFGRKLMQGGGSRTWNQYASTAALDATSSAILNAVNNDASISSTAGAGVFGNVAAQATSPNTRFPVDFGYAYQMTNIGAANPLGTGNN